MLWLEGFKAGRLQGFQCLGSQISSVRSAKISCLRGCHGFRALCLQAPRLLGFQSQCFKVPRFHGFQISKLPRFQFCARVSVSRFRVCKPQDAQVLKPPGFKARRLHGSKVLRPSELVRGSSSSRAEGFKVLEVSGIQAPSFPGVQAA